MSGSGARSLALGLCRRMTSSVVSSQSVSSSAANGLCRTAQLAASNLTRQSSMASSQSARHFSVTSKAASQCKLGHLLNFCGLLILGSRFSTTGFFLSDDFPESSGLAGKLRGFFRIFLDFLVHKFLSFWTNLHDVEKNDIILMKILFKNKKKPIIESCQNNSWVWSFEKMLVFWWKIFPKLKKLLLNLAKIILEF